MMRKHITRTLTRASITAYTVAMVDGKPEAQTLPVVEAWGNVSEKEAIKAVQDVYGKNMAITIGGIVFEDVTYRIDIDKFVANAEIVEKSDDENDN